jgi:SAM-dependent methyltransferase
MNHQCIVCGKRLPQKALFILKDAPASAQNIPDAAEVAADSGITLGLYQCAECGLVQFDCDPVDYYRDVIRAGGFSTTMTGLRRSQYAHMIEKYHLEGKRFIEVGCGRGEFLKVLTEFPVEAYGMEHKADLVKIAQSEGLNVWREFPETADQIFKMPSSERQVIENSAVEESAADSQTSDSQKFDVFLSFNFLEHQPEPSVMLQAIYHNLTDCGMGLVTVPALEYIVEQGSYYELIHDHIAYYSFHALRQLLNRNGFEVLEEEMLNRDTISMIVRKIPQDRIVKDQTLDEQIPENQILKEKALKDPILTKQAAGISELKMTGNCESDSDSRDNNISEQSAMVDSLVRGYEKVQHEVDVLVEEFKKNGKTLAVWGASHQGFTLTSTTALGSCARYIIDSAPFKQGRFAPASHLPIVPPEHFHEEPVDAILIVAPGYTDEIAASIRTKFGADVEIMTMRTDHVESLT